jgi:hypothetical protein
MKEELVHMNNSKKAEPEVAVSVNTQMMIGVIFVGVMMIRIDRKLNILARSQISVLESLKHVAEGTVKVEEVVEEATT